jgi:hypothetical protein
VIGRKLTDAFGFAGNGQIDILHASAKKGEIVITK